MHDLVMFEDNLGDEVWLNVAAITSVTRSGDSTSVHLGSDIAFLKAEVQVVLDRIVNHEREQGDLEALRNVCHRFLQANDALASVGGSVELEAEEDEALEDMRRLVPVDTEVEGQVPQTHVPRESSDTVSTWTSA